MIAIKTNHLNRVFMIIQILMVILNKYLIIEIIIKMFLRLASLRLRLHFRLRLHYRPLVGLFAFRRSRLPSCQYVEI